MSCVNCGAGRFINDGTTAFLRQPITFSTTNGVTLKQVTNGTGNGITLTKGTVTKSFPEITDVTVHYVNWGTPKIFIAILTISPTMRTIQLVNTADPSLATRTVFNEPANSMQSGPYINYCPGDGSAVLILFQTLLQLWPSDGNVTAPLASSLANTGPNVSYANATGTDLQIFGGSGALVATVSTLGTSLAAPIDFGTVIIGPGVPMALSQATKPATIKNTGTGCFQVTGVGNNAPFSVVPGSLTPGTVQPGGSLNFNILFNPGAVVGSPFAKDLNIAFMAIPFGNQILHCTGKARAPMLSISSPAPSFPITPVGQSVTKPLHIKNTGEADISLLSFPASTSPDFTWMVPALPVNIPYGTTLDIQITFTPPAAGADSKTINFTTTGGVNHSLTFNGTGCVPHAVIQLDGSPVDAGSVEKGFRTVRTFTVNNAGNDVLKFDMAIQPAMPGDNTSISDAALFGLLQDENTPVTSPLTEIDNVTISPISACGGGSTGAGSLTFGIAFFANGPPATATPRTVNAVLQIFNHNDTSSGAPASFSIGLTAQITNPVSVDVELVIDHSGSMSESSGARKKIDVAIDAAQLFTRLMRPDVDDRIGGVRFDTTPEIVPSLGIQTITAANQLMIQDAFNATNLTPAGNTCIAGGVMVAEDEIRNNPRTVTPASLNKVVLVLTDGMDNSPYKNPSDQQYYSLLGGTLPLFGSNPFTTVDTVALPVPTDLKIYAVGIGDDIDVARLGQLSSSTGGAFLHTTSFTGTDYFNLEKHFTQVYMEAVNYAQISDPVYEIHPGETQTFPFEVLTGDQSAMVVIYDKDSIRIPFTIYTPTGEIIDLLAVPPGFQIRPGISPTARFIEIRMPQGEPDRYAGTWKVVLKHDGRACFTESKTGSLNRLVNRYQDELTADVDLAFQPGFQPTTCRTGYKEPIIYGIAIGAGSNFKLMAYVSPGIVKTGEPIYLNALLSEFGLPVRGCVVNVAAVKPDGTQSQHVLVDDGNHFDEAKNDGNYGLAFTQTFMEGTYTFTFTATGQSRDGKTVKRQIVRSKYVEGRAKLIPTGPATTVGTAGDCCSKSRTWIIIAIVLLALIASLLLLIWKK